MTSALPAKASEEEHHRWKIWARRNGLADNNNRFLFTNINERRSVFRSRLEQKDQRLIGAIEQVLINEFHFKNSTTERWPKTIRVMLNSDGVDGQAPQAFESWVGPPGLEKRKQSTRVWTDLIQFFVLEYHINNVTWSNNSTTMHFHSDSGYLTEMGLTLSDDFCDDIMDVVQGGMFGADFLKLEVRQLCLNIIMHKNATPRNNPILFWVALLLQTEEFGNQPRLEFASLKDNLTMREKLEALVHYARVIIMDHAFQTWLLSDSVSESWKKLVQAELNSKDWSWSDEGTARPVEQDGDPEDFSQPHWQAFKAHFDTFRTAWLVKGSKSPIGVILGLL
jgi:hypothetical protein